MKLPNTAAEARKLGIPQYFTGKPCKHGHIYKRSSTNNTCMKCIQVIQVALRKTNKQKHLIKRRAYYARNAERLSAKSCERRALIPNEVHRANAAAWRDANRDKYRFLMSKRQRRVIVATPRWADKAKILAVYTEAARITRETGILHHVDHVIPLQSKIVCGLHVHFNLQPIPMHENFRKRNKFVVTA